jgi:hypothetical protein
MSGMYPWERMRSLIQAYAPVGTATFTPEEFANLEALRKRLQQRVVDVELDLDDCRLKFVRWLVKHDVLSEDIRPS